MAVNKTGLERMALGVSDPAVDAAFGMSNDPVYGKLAKETARRRSQTKRQRRQAAADAKRNKVTYDLPEWLTDEIRRIADEGDLPPAHLAGLLMTVGLEALRDGKLKLFDFRVPANSPRYVWYLKYDQGAKQR